MRFAPRHWFSVAVFLGLVAAFMLMGNHFETATNLDALSPFTAACALVVAVSGFFVSRAAVRKENQQSRSTQFLKRLVVGGSLFILTVYAAIFAVTYGFGAALGGAAIIAGVAAALIWASGTHGLAYAGTIAATIVAIFAGYFGAAVTFNDLDVRVTRAGDIKALETNIDAVHDYLASGKSLYTFKDAVGDPQSEILMLPQGEERFGHAMVSADGQFLAVLQAARAEEGDVRRDTCSRRDTRVLPPASESDPDITLSCYPVPGHDATIVVEKRVDDDTTQHSFSIVANADEASYVVVRGIPNVELADPAAYAADLLDTMIEFEPREWNERDLNEFIDTMYATAK